LSHGQSPVTDAVNDKAAPLLVTEMGFEGTVPPGSKAKVSARGETESGELMVPLNAWEALCGDAWLSVTLMVKLNGPAAVGVPLTEPVAVFSDRPAGRDPLPMEKV